MKTPADASQGKIKVRLEILPEKQSFENRILAAEIAEDISKHLDQTQNYRVEIPYTGEMGGGSELLVWIIPVVEFVGKPFAEAFIGKVAEKVADLTEEILEKVRKGRYRKLEADVTVQSLPGSDEINVQGPLEHTLDKVGVDLKNIAIDVWTKRCENKAFSLAEKGRSRVKFKEKEKQELYVDGS